MNAPDFPNIARNLFRINAQEGSFGFSDREGGCAYRLLDDGRYEFRDTRTNTILATVHPRGDRRSDIPMYQSPLSDALDRLRQAEQLLMECRALLMPGGDWEAWNAAMDDWLKRYDRFRAGVE